MSELRVNGKSEDGLYLSLLDSDGKEFSVRISDTLRSTVNQPRLMSVQDDEAAPISVKEIQRRLRTGESPESIAQDGNISVEKVERFSGPILQERQFIIDQVATVIVRKEPGREPVNFGDAIVLRLAPRGVDIDQISWNTWRLPDGVWHIELSYPNRDGNGVATWNFDLSRRALDAADDNGAWLIDEDAPARQVATGIIHSEPTHPSRIEANRVEDIFTPVVEEKPETPRLAVIRETPSPADSQDGITARAKVPSWDEIMFGHKSEETPEDN